MHILSEYQFYFIDYMFVNEINERYIFFHYKNFPL